jgi:glycosyltransferase involved in cell wall biosynthesis
MVSAVASAMPVSSASPLVSVVVPVFNAAPFLRTALNSVLAQTYPAFEVIVVDDGSSDGSTQILGAYRDRVRVYEQSRKGAAAARNLGVRHARGQYIAFQDADDYWFPTKLARQVDHALSNPSHSIVFSQFAYWYPDGNGDYRDPRWFLEHPETWLVPEPLSGYIYADELLDSLIAMIVPLVHRDVFERLGGFDERLEAGSDYDFWLRATNRFQAHKIPECFALYRIHGTGITGTPRATNFPYVVLKRAVETMGLSGPDGRSANAGAVRKRLADTWLNFALLHLRRGSPTLGREALHKYLAIARYHPRAMANYAFVRAQHALRR